MTSTRPPSPLLRELLKASQMARGPLFAPRLSAAGLPVLGVPLWGIDVVSAGTQFYQPDEAGTLAAIVAAYHGRSMVDLVACSFTTRETRTRKGVAVVLGEEWIEDARFGSRPLRIFDDVFTWLNGSCRGVVVIDWQEAPHHLRDISQIHCESAVTADRLIRAFERPTPYPRVLVCNGDRP
ncbi:MAG TPA: hypothetical protein VH328_16325 [Burkholderiaceae bacterium]|nr:hypothetical protein [Burkholderiaceae bacterium]